MFLLFFSIKSWILYEEVISCMNTYLPYKIRNYQQIYHF